MTQPSTETLSPRRHLGPRAEHRQRENLRANSSATIAEKFPELKSLTADLEYRNSDAGGPHSQIKYRVNIANARSVFLFDCPSSECIAGDFDLSHELTDACARHNATVEGELRCQGWRSKSAIGTCRCHYLLRYRLNLEYDKAAPTETA